MERRAIDPNLIIYEAETVAALDTVDPVAQGYRTGYEAGLKRMLPLYTQVFAEVEYFEQEVQKARQKIKNVLGVLND